MADPIRILLADDHPVFRAGVRSLLESEPDLRVVAEAASGDEAVAMEASSRPDVVVLDASMPGFGGIEAARRIRVQDERVRILVLVLHAVEECRRTVQEAGAQGCLSKLRADRELIEAIRVVADGGVYLPPMTVTITPSANGVSPNGLGAQALSPVLPESMPLSDRERQVVTLTAGGFSSREIGEKLQISSKTVDTYRARSMEKLGFQHRWELVQYALRTGLLSEL